MITKACKTIGNLRIVLMIFRWTTKIQQLEGAWSTPEGATRNQQDFSSSSWQDRKLGKHKAQKGSVQYTICHPTLNLPNQHFIVGSYLKKKSILHVLFRWNFASNKTQCWSGVKVGPGSFNVPKVHVPKPYKILGLLRRTLHPSSIYQGKHVPIHCCLDLRDGLNWLSIPSFSVPPSCLPHWQGSGVALAASGPGLWRNMSSVFEGSKSFRIISSCCIFF